ncbi:MAG TPA: PEGA domain-containing protein, partial [Bryobacteraceae bacterium]
HEMETGPVIPIPNYGSGETPVYPPPPQFPPQPPQFGGPPPPPPPPPYQQGGRQTGAIQTGGLNAPPYPPPPPSPSGQRPTAGVFAVPPPTSQQQVKPPQSGLNWKRAMMIGAGIGLIGAIAILITVVNIARNRNRVPVPPPNAAALNITTVPPGAKIQINGQDKCTSPCNNLQLAPGDYRITALLEGYDSTLSVATLVAGQPATDVTMTLTSQAQSLRIFSDIAGKVVLDGKQAGDIAEGSFILDRVPAGPHTVAVSGAGADAAFGFEVTPGKAPEIKGAATAHNLLAIIVSSAGAQAHVESSTGPLKALLDGKEEPPIATGGTDFPNVPNGDHELVVGEGKEQKKIQVSFQTTPTLTAYLRSDINAGNLVVVTNPPEDDVTVFINGRPQPRKTSRGQLRVQLVPGNDTVRVAKDGFADVGEQVAVVKKGEDTRLEFKLKSLPRVATLRIKSATSGATVLLDGREIGKVAADGTFQTGGVAPGDHEIEFRMAGFLNKKETRPFKAGETVDLSNVILIQAIGTITMTLSPPDTRVSYRHDNDPEKVAGSTTIPNLAPGRYILTGKAPGHKEKVVSVTVSGGQTAMVDMTLTKEAVVVTGPQSRPGSITDFDPAWTHGDGDSYTHAGSSTAFRIVPAIGTFRFKVQLLKGGNALGMGKKIRWAIGYTDGKDHTLFELEKNKFRRSAVAGGKAAKGNETKLAGGSDSFDVVIEITPNRIVHRIQGVIVDTDSDAPNLSTGKFVFLLNPNEEIEVSGFSFTPGH